MAGYDPLTDLSSEASLEEKALIARKLRQPSGMTPWMDAARTGLDSMFADEDLKRLKAKREAARRADDAEYERLASDPSNAAYAQLLRTRGARGEAVKGVQQRIKDEEEMKAFKEAIPTIRGQGGALPQTVMASGGPMSVPGQPGPQDVDGYRRDLSILQGSPRKSIAAAAKAMEEYMAKGQVPDHLYPGMSGPPDLSPNAPEAMRRSADIKNESQARNTMTNYPMGGTREQPMSVMEALQRSKSALPNATNLLGAPGGASGGSPTPPPGNVPSSPVAGPGAVSTPPPGATPPPNDPEWQKIQAAVQRVAGLPDNHPDKQRVMAIMDAYLAKTGAGGTVSVPPSQGQPPSQPPSPLQTLPDSPVGGAPPPGVRDPMYGERVKMYNESQGKLYEQADKAKTQAITTRQIADNLEAVSKKALSGGFAGALEKGGAAVTGLFNMPAPSSVANSEKFEAEAGKLYRELIGVFGAGNGISNLDLLTVEKQIPNLAKSKEGRDLILESMKKAADINEYNADRRMKLILANRGHEFQFDTTAGGKYDKIPLELQKGYGTAENSPASFLADFGRSAKEYVTNPGATNAGLYDSLLGQTDPRRQGEPGYRQGSSIPEGMAIGAEIGGGAAIGKQLIKHGAALPMSLRQWLSGAVKEAPASALPKAAAAEEGAKELARTRMQFKNPSSRRPYKDRKLQDPEGD